jgi:hypothetical protein
MRLAYAASCSNLPHGTPVRERFDAPQPFREEWRYQLGRYRITFSPPFGWPHVGIFMVRVPQKHSTRDWYFPSEIGVYDTWAAACECALAVDQGWRVEVHERVTFTPKPGAPRPLELWRDKLLAIHDDGDPAVQSAVRKIILYTIGSFHPRPIVKRETRSEFPTAAPAGTKIDRNADGTWTVSTPVPMSEKRALFDHPEWALEIWARTRTKLLHYARRVNGETQEATGALTLPRQSLLGFQLDGVITSAPAPWADDGKRGSFRLKDERHWPNGRRAPDAAHRQTLYDLFPAEEPPDEEATAEGV